MMYLAEQTHVAPLVTIRRDRHLPVPGEVLVKLDQRVEPMEVVARAVVNPSHRLLDIAREFRLTPAAADKSIARKAGDLVKVGDVLAQKPGLIPSRVFSPVEGRVIAVGGGQMLLQVVSDILQVRSPAPGIVVNLTPEHGVTVETIGALVQAAWGNGRQDFGVLRVLVSEPGAPLTAASIDVGHRGAVVCGGHCSDPAALEMAAAIQVRGLILGSLSSRLRVAAEAAHFPVILTEGWGDRPMCRPAFELLRSNDGREIALDGTSPDRTSGTRPEIIVPLPAAGLRPNVPGDGQTLSVGQRVRVLRAPYASAVGILTALGDRPILLPSEVRALSAKVELEGFGNVWVPLQNLEILE